MNEELEGVTDSGTFVRRVSARPLMMWKSRNRKLAFAVVHFEQTGDYVLMQVPKNSDPAPMFRNRDFRQVMGMCEYYAQERDLD